MCVCVGGWGLEGFEEEVPAALQLLAPPPLPL